MNYEKKSINKILYQNKNHYFSFKNRHKRLKFVHFISDHNRRMP